MNWRAIAGSACCSPKNAIPVRDAVRGACELLGLDPLHIANEGQFLAVVAPEYADAALAGVARDARRTAKPPSSAKSTSSPRPRFLE